MVDRITNAFATGKPILIPYLTLGDPDLATSGKAIHTLVRAGADMIELGVPFTDPVADGPTIQKSSERALRAPFDFMNVFQLTNQLRADGIAVPFVLMSYANPIYVFGMDRFCEQAVQNGIDAVLITDIPPEEADDYRACAKKHGLKTVFLCSPTTSPERLRLIDEASDAYVYYVARAGVTGARADLPQDIQHKLSTLRRDLKNPLCVGFGISTPEQVANLAPYADGLIIGSALVALFETYTGHELQEKIYAFTQALKKRATHV